MNIWTLADVIGEGANINLVAEAWLLGFGFQGLDLITSALIGSAACPECLPATKFEAQFCGAEAFAASGLLFLRQILRPVTEAASVVAEVAE